MSEEEIKTMVNNAFKRLSKELEENPDNLINYSKLQEKYIQLLKDKVKLKQENQKYKEVFDKTIEIIEEDKYIEELYISRNDITYPDGAINDDELVDCILEITSKINKLIKEVNKLRKEDK